MAPQPRCPSRPTPEVGEEASGDELESRPFLRPSGPWLPIPDVPSRPRLVFGEDPPVRHVCQVLPTPPVDTRDSVPSKPKVSSVSKSQKLELLAGWLLKRTGGEAPKALQGLAGAVAGGVAQGVLWRRRYFVLTGETVSYWRTLADRSDYQVPTGSFEVLEIDDIIVSDRQVVLHFAAPQRAGRRERSTLCVCAASSEEAETWASAIRQAVAQRLRSMLPSGWDVGNMLGGGGGVAKRVKKVELQHDLVKVVQELVDHSFICKRTRDRRGKEVPVRIEVAKVICVQNASAWMAYERARNHVRLRMQSSSAAPLVPEVLTSTMGASREGAPCLGVLDEESNEQWLFHGTRISSAQDITDKEFRMDLAGTHRGTLYGKAVYLAECSSKADEYSEADEDGICRMLLCRVALGSILRECERHPIAPEVEAECRQGYDSLCGDRWAAVGTFREFVLYESSQVYPEYIIHYRRMMQGELLQAIGQIAPEECETSARVHQLVPHAAQLAQTHPDQQARYRISLLLGAHAGTVVPALAFCLKDENPLRRRSAAAALAHIADFMALSRSTSASGVSESDSRDKERSNPLVAAVPGLITCLEDPNESVRKASAQALEQIGPCVGKAVVPSLAACLSDSSEEVRCAAAAALEKMGGDHAASAVPALAQCLKDDNVSVRKAAISALGHLGPAVKPALSELIACLHNSNFSVRCTAAESLQRLGPFAISALPALLKCMHDENVGVRTVAAAALGTLGSYAASATVAEALCRTLTDSHEGVRAASAAALGNLGHASAVPALVEALKDINEDVRRASAAALGQMREAAVSAIPQLHKALKDTNEDVRKVAATSLGLFGAVASGAVPGLTVCLSDTTVSVRKAAAVALGQIGHPSRGAICALNERLKDPNEGVRKASLKSYELLHRRRMERGGCGPGGDGTESANGIAAALLRLAEIMDSEDDRGDTWA